MATIIDSRGGGFAEGCRNKGAFYYALALKGNGESRDQALTAVLAMGKDCSPPLSAGECQRAVREAYKGTKRVRLYYQTLADALDVDQREAEIVSQRIAHHFPAASRHGEIIPLTHLSGEDTRETRRAKRWAAIIELVEESRKNVTVTPGTLHDSMVTVPEGDGDRAASDRRPSLQIGTTPSKSASHSEIVSYGPSFREMAAKLRDRMGMDVSYVTVRADYAALGISSSWSRQPSPVSGSFAFIEPQASEVDPTSILARET
jgi:hypothetical protein